MEKIKITVPESKLQAWARMEDRNQHGLRLWSIANFFYKQEGLRRVEKKEFLDVQHVLYAINQAHEDIGYLTEFLYDLRNTCRFRLRDRISEYFGEDVLHEVNP